MLPGCSKEKKLQPAVNDYVAEYTTGVISRRTPIEIVLNDPLSGDQLNQELLQSAFRITPEVKGKIEVVDDRKLLFQPIGMLKPGTEYTVNLEVGKLFKTDKRNRNFTFSFETVAPEVGFRLREMDVDNNTGKDTLYEFKASLLLSDWADSATVYNLIGFNMPVKVNWEKLGVAKTFDFTFQTREPLNKAQDIEIFTKKNAMGYAKKVIATLQIPGKDDFDVYSILPVANGEEFVEVTFTRMLDANQDFAGLVEVEPEGDVSYSVEENKLRIWFQENKTNDREITIHDGIRSQHNRILKTKTTTPDHYHKIVSFQNNYPALSFVGDGNILPDENSMVVPFIATNLRGVILRVIKVYQNNMGQFLQNNPLSEGNELAGVGELLCRKIIFLDEKNNYDLQQPNLFALDLKELITPEPGTLYRIYLSYNFELSAYPCPGVARMTKRELIEENKRLEAEEKANFGNGNSYFYFSDQSWNNYNWKERDMPCKESYYVDKQISKNVLYSTLGVMAKRGDRGKMLVAVNNLLSGDPEEEADVKVYSYQHQVIAQKSTWENGIVEIDLEGKEPFYLIAKKGKQKGYLRMANEEALSMSSFDVAGEEVKNGTKGFIYTERGVWRPGDTIYVSFILNSVYGDLPERHPVTFELFNPAGQVYWRKSLSTRSDNFYVFKPVTSVEAPTGVWKGKITVGGVSFEKKIRIETIKPNRLSIDLSFDEKLLQRDTLTKATLKSQWLTGATANSLNYDIYTTFVPMKTTFEGYKEYVFDDASRNFTANDVLFAKGKLDEKGVAQISTRMVEGAFASGFLRAQFLTKVYEESGEFSVNTTQQVYSPFKSYVGILSPQKEDTPLTTNKQQTFRFATLLPNGTPNGNSKIKVQIYKVEWYWWWNSDRSEIANYIASGYNKPVKQFENQSNENGQGEFLLKIPDMEWGTYYIQLTDSASGHQCGCLAYFDSYGDNARSRLATDKAMLLTLQTDKENYAPDEQITVRFPSTKESRAIITVEASGGILQHHEIKCKANETAFSFKATKEMQPNVYVSVLLLNPYASSKYDLPIRLYGVIPVQVHAANSRLNPIIDAPEAVRPATAFNLSVSEAKGYPMTFTVGIVDEGLLDLTNFKTPSPWDAFFAKEALGMRTWDMYNDVLGALGGKIGQVFSIGGDDALNKGPKAIVNRFKPVVRFMGPFTLKANEKRTLLVRLPEYIGKVRCMVVAGNEHQFGNAQKDIAVKQPLMILGTLPRKLAPGDEIWVPATVFAMKEKMGVVTVSLDVNDAFSVLDQSSQQISFSKEGNQVVWFKLKAKQQQEVGIVRLSVQGNGEKAEWSSEIAISSPLNPISKSNNQVLNVGESKTIELKPFGMKGSNKGKLTVSGIKQVKLNRNIDYLINYPYACLEQIISKALCLLYLPQIAQFSASEQEKMEEIVRKVNSNLKNYMVPGGGFSLWPGGTSTNGWASIYAFLYLNKTADNGFVLSPGMRRECGSYQSRLAREWKPVISPILPLEQVTQAFRLYVLADANIPEKGAMNRLRQEKNLPSAAKWLLSAAYAKENKEVARQILESMGEVKDVNEEGMMTKLFLNAVELNAFMSVDYSRQAYTLVESILEQLQSDQELNTAESAFALIEVCEYYKKFPPTTALSFELSQNGNTQTIQSEKALWSDSFENLNATQKIKITNTGKGMLYLQEVMSGIALQGEQIETANGITLTTSFKSLKGERLDIKNLPQGMDFIFEIRVTNTAGIMLSNLMVDQWIPAGWEILNQRLFLGDTKYPAGVSYQDIRDERVSSYIEWLPAQQYVVIPIYITTAYAGSFFMPATSCKGIYLTNYNASTKSKFVTVTHE